MKPVKEILKMLVTELSDHLDKIRVLNQKLTYYNEMLGDTSFLLGGLLESILKRNFSEWDNNKWIDDSLISSIELRDNKLTIIGIMIWGIEKTTEQWTEPFSFEIKFTVESETFENFIFLFGDLEKPEITYEEFRDNIHYWANCKRNWKYIIDSDHIPNQ